MDCVDATKAIDMSLDEIIQYNDPHIAYDAHAEYFLCNQNQQQSQEYGESEPSKCKKRRRFYTNVRQKNSRFSEVTNRRFTNQESDAQDLEEGEYSQPMPYEQNAQVLPVKSRLGRPRYNFHYQKNHQRSNSNHGQGRNRNRYYQRNYQEQEGLTVQISNRGQANQKREIKEVKREIKEVLSLRITAHSD